jgi:hypothetical protein
MFSRQLAHRRTKLPQRSTVTDKVDLEHVAFRRHETLRPFVIGHAHDGLRDAFYVLQVPSGPSLVPYLGPIGDAASNRRATNRVSATLDQYRTHASRGTAGRVRPDRSVAGRHQPLSPKGTVLAPLLLTTQGLLLRTLWRGHAVAVRFLCDAANCDRCLLTVGNVRPDCPLCAFRSYSSAFRRQSGSHRGAPRGKYVAGDNYLGKANCSSAWP